MTLYIAVCFYVMSLRCISLGAIILTTLNRRKRNPFCPLVAAAAAVVVAVADTQDTRTPGMITMVMTTAHMVTRTTTAARPLRVAVAVELGKRYDVFFFVVRVHVI